LWGFYLKIEVEIKVIKTLNILKRENNSPFFLKILFKTVFVLTVHFVMILLFVCAILTLLKVYAIFKKCTLNYVEVVAD